MWQCFICSFHNIFSNCGKKSCPPALVVQKVENQIFSWLEAFIKKRWANTQNNFEENMLPGIGGFPTLIRLIQFSGLLIKQWGKPKTDVD
jgi:hypothetical protein